MNRRTSIGWLCLISAVAMAVVGLRPASAGGRRAYGPALPWIRPVPWMNRPAPSLPNQRQLVAPSSDPVPAGQPGVGTWAQVLRTWPDSTAGGGMAYDPVRDQALFFGGCCSKGDTWLWKDGAWTLAQPSTSPSARNSVAMAWDGANQDVVMFGGDTDAETWTWDGSNWTLHRPATSPQFRNDPVMAYAPALHEVVLFGGYPNVATQGQLGDTWLWDGSTWTQAQPAHNPPPRYGAGMATDPATGDVVLFGGLDDTYHSLGDTWIFDGTDWRQSGVTTSPPARSYPQMATNGSTGRVELFGGYDLEAGASQLGDEWTWNGRGWRQVSRTAFPEARCCGGFVYQASSGSMLLFDGTCSPTCGGMWIERDGRWHERPLPRPLERMGGGFAWDPAVHGSLLFGGFGDSFGSGDMNDTWIWTGSRWRVVQQNVQPGGTGPPVRQYPAMAYDARSNRMVLFGGSGAAYPDPELGDTWTFDGSGWTQIAPPVAPAPRYDHVMATNPGGGVVLFGGYGKDGLLGDTWIERDGAWSDVQPASSPPARYWAAMAYDQRMKQVVLFGGGATGGVSMGDTWLWDGRTWTQANPPVAPTARLGATMTYDPATGEVWLFGGAGCGPAVCEITNDVWTWDGSTWTRQVATSGPGARWFADCAPSRGGGIALFGGQGGGSSLPMSEMWRWDGPSQTGPARSARSVG